MRKVLLTLLVVVLILAGLGAAGFAGYRVGYAQGSRIAVDGDTQLLMPGFAYGPHRMPMHGFDREFGPGRNLDRGFGMRPGGMMGFGFFGPLLFLAQIAFWGIVIWAIYTLIIRSGWRLTRTTQPVETQPAPADSETKG